jgi:hypothetical protein
MASSHNMPVATLIFVEPGSDEECVATVRTAADLVMIGLSRKTDGDIEVGFPVERAQELLAAIRKSLDLIRVP